MTVGGFACFILWMVILVVMSIASDWLLARIFTSGKHRLFVWLGVIVHETSHWAACKLTRTEVFEVAFFERSGGHVKHERRGPVILAVIALAPILGGSLFLLFLAWAFRQGGVLFATGGIDLADPLASFGSLLGSAGATAMLNLAPLNGVTVLFLVFVYLAWSVASCLAPSTPDLKHASGGAVVLVLGCLAAVLLRPLSMLGFGGTPVLDLFVGLLTGTVGLALMLSLLSLAIAVPAAALRSR